MIQERAKELFEAMEQKKRSSGETFYCLKQGSPEWMTEVIHKAHGDRLPDDDAYEVINEVAAVLADADPNADIDGLREVIVEIEPDVYTSQLTAWLNRSNANVYYLTEALEEGMGITDSFQLLGRAQYLFKQEIANAVLDELEKLEGEAQGREPQER